MHSSVLDYTPLSLFVYCLSPATTRPASGSLIQRATLMDSCCGNASFTVGSPVVLLNGSVEVVGGYIYHSEGSSCDIRDLRANISIREGMPIGEFSVDSLFSIEWIVHFKHVL